MKRRVQRAVVASIAIVISLGGVNAAAAYFTAGGTGSGTASTGTLSVSVSATTGTPTTPLIPGGTGDVTLKVTNPNNVVVTLTTVTGNGAITADGGHPGCSPTGVTFTNQTPNLTVPANATDFAVSLSGAAAMSTSSANGCQGATFSVPVAITVQQP
jgi:hypothetical protein